MFAVGYLELNDQETAETLFRLFLYFFQNKIK